MPIFSKVKAVGIGGGLAGIIVTIIVMILESQGVVLDPQTVALITSGITALIAFLSGYLKRERVLYSI